MAPPRGIGLAQVPSSPTPQSSTLTSLGNALTGTPSSIPNFQDNPLGAIGLLLSNFAAGARGQTLPTQRIQQQRLQQQQLNLQQLRVNLDAVRQGVEMFIGLDPDDPRTADAITRFTEQFVPVLGEGFRESMTAGLELARNQGQEAIDGLVEHQQRIQGICGLDQKCIQDVAANASLMNQFNETADQQRLGGIVQKFQQIGEIVGDEAIDALKADGFTISDLSQLPAGFAFTPEEIRTISRNEQIQNALIPLGFQPPDIERLALETVTTEGIRAAFRPTDDGPLTTIGKLNADLEAGRITPEQHSDAVLKATTIVGRTEQDVGLTPSEAEAAEAGEAARTEAANVASFATLLAEFERLGPGVAGIRALLGEVGGGLLGQLNEAVGEGFSEFVSGASPEEIASIRQRARISVAQQLTQITGEEGRFTEQERRIAEEANRTLPADASFAQIRGALSTAVRLAYVSRDRNEMVAGIEPRFDLSTEAGEITAATELLDLGLTPTEVFNTIEQLTLQRRLIGESGGRR
ncbi:MAG: hypothetical protein ACR2P5_06570 [Gammaproteobacteria bacterium]